MSLISDGFTLLGTLKIPSVTGSESNVPLLIRYEDFTVDMLAALESGGGGLALSGDSGGVDRLPLDVTRFTKATGDVVWVLVPTAVIDTLIYVWNKTGASQPAVDAAYGSEAVWAEYEFVSKTGLVDASGNLTISGGGGTLVTGPFGNTDGAKKMTVAGHGSLALLLTPLSFPYTISTWSLVEGTSDNRLMGFGHSTSASPQTNMFTQASSTTSVSYSGSTPVDTTPSTVLINTFHRQTATVSAAGVVKTYSDGLYAGTVTTSLVAFNRIGFGISADSTPFARVPLTIAEGRFCRQEHSLARIEIEHSNQSATTAWWIAEDAGGGGATQNVDMNLASATPLVYSPEIVTAQEIEMSLVSGTASVYDFAVLPEQFVEFEIASGTTTVYLMEVLSGGTEIELELTSATPSVLSPEILAGVIEVFPELVAGIAEVYELRVEYTQYIDADLTNSEAEVYLHQVYIVAEGTGQVLGGFTLIQFIHWLA